MPWQYTVIFCPGGKGSGLNPPPASSAKKMDTTPGDNSGNLQGGPAQSNIWGKGSGQPVEGGSGNIPAGVASSNVPAVPAGSSVSAPLPASSSAPAWGGRPTWLARL
ncbi:uncharacterized protein I303_106515 [Kwoniella dejecticola CBS 10117]|uniref:Uncharacterized protein n=1 Tax=Kwoniella dejecticola CBS 10117 TaxID=1296121 RepID=A0A1A5ZUH3_9TREE|nr:uncharacterized protein I303_08227 [Kwoniella dejecticola CBS 10117]OBR81457.1 hypothetical protein I303_08227 [Kwoniella dejecticola CBS 10117]